MSAFFGLLFFIAIISLIVGLIRPKTYVKFVGPNHTRVISSILLSGMAVVCLVIGVATVPPDSSTPSTASATQKPEDVITKLIKDDLSDTNDVGDQKFRNVDIVPQAGGGLGVFVDYSPDQTGHHDTQMTMFTVDMTKLYKTIYHDSHQDVRTASVSAYFSGTDQYANKSDRLIYKTILNKDVADKINWDADEATIEAKMPGLWSVTIDATSQYGI